MEAKKAQPVNQLINFCYKTVSLGDREIRSGKCCRLLRQQSDITLTSCGLKHQLIVAVDHRDRGKRVLLERATLW